MGGQYNPGTHTVRLRRGMRPHQLPQLLFVRSR